MLYLFVILYIFNGHAVLEQKLYPTMEACQAAGDERAIELQLDGDKYIITGGCAKLPSQAS